MSFDMSEYVDVAARIRDFKDAFPDGSLRPLNPDKPIEICTIGDKTFIVYAAAAYRTPDDQAPGVGIAWEPFPGRTPYTRDSELQNAETSAWGRAIVASLASTTKKIAAVEDVRNRQADRETPPVEEVAALVALKRKVWKAQQAIGIDDKEHAEADYATRNGGAVLSQADEDNLRTYLNDLIQEAKQTPEQEPA